MILQKYINKSGIKKISDDKEKTFEKVSSFYNAIPFPNYEDNESKNKLLSKGDSNFLAKKTKEFLGFNKKILEVGCGTAQLSNYLAIGTNNKIYALDSAIGSLKLGYQFSQKNHINNIEFIEGDLTKEIFQENSFDFIWCNGVLHHTRDPKLGFKQICKSLKSNGYILLGLYNRYGRLRTIFRQIIFKYISKKIAIFLDPYLRKLNKEKKRNKSKIDAWINDQYQHPVESVHTFDETLDWFKEYKIEFINSLPSIDLINNENIFKKKNQGNKYLRLISQIIMLFGKLGSEGGLYIFIGKKK